MCRDEKDQDGSDNDIVILRDSTVNRGHISGEFLVGLHGSGQWFSNLVHPGTSFTYKSFVSVQYMLLSTKLIAQPQDI